MTPQVSREHYATSSYGFEGRFVSYYWQLKEVLGRTPSSVLEVGVGDRVFGSFLKNNTDIQYRSVDIAEDLAPDTVGSVLALPEADKSYDIACAFEVLEHLPFSDFDKALSELVRVAKKHVIISLPHFGPMLAFSLKIPFIPRLQAAVKIPFPKTHTFNGQHYWELGKQGYPASLIRKKLSAYGSVTADYVPFNSPYHHFYVVTLPQS